MRALRINNKKNLFISLVAILTIITIIFAAIKLYPTFSEKLTSSIWDGSIATSFQNGDGSESNPYIITEGSEFALLFNKLKSEDSSSYFNKFYEIKNNIDFDNRDFSFIETSKTFSGTINGNGYTLSNLNFNNCSSNEETATCEYSLFSNLNGANIKNLNITNLKIAANKVNQKRTLSVLATNAKNSTLNNISLSNIKYNISEDENYETQSAGLLINDNQNNNISNIHIDLNDSNSNSAILINNYNNSQVSNIIYHINNLNLFNNAESSNITSYGYNKTDNIITFENQYPVKSIINILNKNSNFTWTYANNTIRLMNNEIDEIALTNETAGITSHESGIENNIVYVNDFLADYDYYMGLNYTSSSNQTIPTRTSKEIYSESNLVYVAATYKGADYNNQNIGKVSLTEEQDTYIYYKVYEINTNGTEDTSDDFVEFDLIDNPFANRPANKAFNGWLTEYTNATIEIDRDIYVRKVKIPVTYENGKPNPIEITFYSSWINARTYNISGNNWNSAFNYFFDAGLKLAKGTVSYWEIDDLYYSVRVPRNGQIYRGDYQESGWYGWQEVTSNTTCRSNGGCDIMRPARGTEYSSTRTYYTKAESWYGASFNETTPQHINETSEQVNIGDLAGGLYREVILPYGDELYGYYNSDAEMLTTGTCNQANGCQYYELIKIKNENGTLEKVLEGVKYYFLVTRDTNIAFVTGNISGAWSNQSKPFTLTAINNQINNINRYYWDQSDTLNIGADTRIEMIRINSGKSMQTGDDAPYTNRTIFGNYYNLKIGRGITQYNNYASFDAAAGGSTSFSGTTVKRYTFIVESGFYNNLGLTTTTSSSGTHYVMAYGTYGNDYDRVTNNNNNFIVQYCASGSWGATIRSTSTSTTALNTTVKSGNIGKNNYDYAAGLYVGGRNNGNHYVLRKAIIEGGTQANVIGGPLSVESNVKNGNTFLNDTFIYVKGGTPSIIVGGAGASSTYGNRITQVTGGTVGYAVFGGSNGVMGSDSGQYPGILYGDSYVYIGGHATIGNDSQINHTVSKVESGSVFGAGNGNSSSVGVGSVNNSYIVIDGNATIKKNVYGGGNYGATGYGNKKTYNPSNTEILLAGGTINGSVYGAGNNNGAGNYAHTITSGSGWYQTKIEFFNINSQIKINMTGGNVKSGIYGGSNVTGIVYGSTELNIKNGKVSSVYGGGEGQNTFVRDNIDVTIGTQEEGPNISGNVYGGSAFGTVNATTTSESTNSKTVNVTVNNGNITGDVFGGAKGDASSTPKVKGKITVNINGGTIANVYGGFDANGTPENEDSVYLNGGVIGQAFGGGKNTSQTNTNIYLKGAKVDYIYGGSNQSGLVNITNVYIESGNANHAFGGNNLGGTCEKTNVIMTGGKITEGIFGGGNKIETQNANLTINNGTVNNAYGGGNNAGVSGKTNVIINGGTISKAFGGSNETGTVQESNITLNGSTNTQNQDNSLETIITPSSRAIADWEKTNYGTNFNQVVTVNVEIKNNSDKTIKSWEGTINIPKSKLYNNYSSDTEVIDNNGKYTFTSAGRWNTQSNHELAPGSSYTFNFTILQENTYFTSEYKITGKNETEEDLTSTNTGFKIYGGNNKGGLTNNANVNIKNGYAFEVYGGGNEADVNNPKVTVTGGTTHNIYGGGNAANIINNTSLDISGGQITNNVYGGGNFGEVLKSTFVSITNGIIQGSAYGGGNGSPAIVNENTNITVSGTTTIGSPSCSKKANCSLFGGGNAAATGKDGTSKSTVNLAGGHIYGNVYGGANTSVVKGDAIVNVANSAVSENTIKAPIMLDGTIFGGGEANASGSDTYDYSFISVTKSITVNLDATNFSDINIKGSIFGSGNASSSSGTSNINITKFGSDENPKKITSIQRTDILNINNSGMILIGATDRTNEYSDTLFALSIIGKLNLKNNSSLYLESGTNLLQEFNSLVDDSTLAEVVIDEETGSYTRNVDNRIYALEGVKAINIAKGETIDETATDYGEVNGMTFFGLYTYNSSGHVNAGIYKKSIQNGDDLNWGDMPTQGSYVLGLHKANHDITKDGFYSNFMNEETSKNKANYITPTPENSDFYMWIIGELIVEYNIDLSASKYSTLGVKEVSFYDFADPNTNFEILGFDYSNLKEGVSLVEREDVPRIAATTTDADNIMSLKMETGSTGWINRGETVLLSKEPSIIGDKKYIGENSNAVPTLAFYLYHSKNLGTTDEMGKVSIVVMAIRRIDGLTSETKRIVINVNLSRVLYNTNDYEGAITSGRKYEIFPSTAVDITDKSSISAYFSLYKDDENVYKDGDNRSLVSTSVLPLHTKITMIDLSKTTPEYYYHTINEDDITRAEAEIASHGDVSYPLSSFETMGALNSNVYYNNGSNSADYYNPDKNTSSEEFIFILDFEDTNIQADMLNNHLILELKDNQGETRISILGNQYDLMSYDIYTGKDAIIDIDGTISKNTIYSGEDFKLDLETAYTQSKSGSTIINDTKLLDNKLGIKISLIDENGNAVSGTSMMGLYYEIDGNKYYPNLDGTTRIKISEKIGNVKTWITINTANSNIPTGSYTLKIDSYGSPDGIYYGLNASDTLEIPINYINEKYGLDIKIDNKDLIINKETGTNIDGNSTLEFTIKYNSVFENPSLNMKLYRRSYNEVYDTNYELVDLQEYLDMTLIKKNNSNNEYIVSSNPSDNTKLRLDLKNKLLNGTYKLEFILYDNNSKIGTVEKYIIIK